LYYSLNYLSHAELSYPGGQPLHNGQHICSSGMTYQTLATNIKMFLKSVLVFVSISNSPLFYI